MPLVENPGIQAIDVWRNLENRTLALVGNPSNADVWVSMHNITGRGTWISAGFTMTQGVAAREVQLRYNINGLGPTTVVLTSASVSTGYGSVATMMIGFESALVVEMRLSGAGANAHFESVAIVE